MSKLCQNTTTIFVSKIRQHQMGKRILRSKAQAFWQCDITQEPMKPITVKFSCRSETNVSHYYVGFHIFALAFLCLQIIPRLQISWLFLK